MVRSALRLPGPLDLRPTLAPLRHGRADPTLRWEGPVCWRASRTVEGPATQAISADPATGELRCLAWGPGAAAALDAFPDLVGGSDDVTGLARLLAAQRAGRRPPGWSVVAGLARRWPGLRIPRTGAVFDACVPAVLEQKVTSLEATTSYRNLVLRFGSPAPGPGRRRGLWVPPPPVTVAGIPSWSLHPLGVERRRAETLRRVAVVAGRLEEAARLPPDDARRRLLSVPGVGPWTAAEVALVAFGDPDAVSVGDYHLPNQVAWSLAGRARGDDAEMLRLLEPWRGQRARVLRLLATAGLAAPRFGPRHAPRRLQAI